MTAVAVWSHRPMARELLDARLEGGWAPTASPLKEGDRVLGFAACVFDGPEHRDRVSGSHQDGPASP